MIFIIGSGRSGTHFLTRILCDYQKFNDQNGGQEFHDILEWTTVDAINHEPLREAVFEHYDKCLERAEKKGEIFIDQCQTNLFHVDQLRKKYPKAIFAMPLRSNEQIISSYQRKVGAFRHWNEAARNGKTKKGVGVRPAWPNQFLGLQTPEQLKGNESDLMIQRCSANKIKQQMVMRDHSDVLYTFKYNDLVHDTSIVTSLPFDMELKNPKKRVRPRMDTITKYLAMPEDYREKIKTNAYELQELVHG